MGFLVLADLFATNQVSPDTERCYRYQLRNFAQWMETEQGENELDLVVPMSESVEQGDDES